MTPTDARHDPASKAQRDRRLRDRALVLPLAGVFLYLSAIPRAVSGLGDVMGIPAVYLFFYGLWLVLIIASARLSRRLLTDVDLDGDT